MVEPVLSTGVIQRTEELAEKIGFKRRWDGPVFMGSSYEHVLPLFEATYEWITYGHFRSPSQQSRKSELERAAVEIWPPSYTGAFGEIAQYDPTIVRAQVFIAHLLLIQSVPGAYVVGMDDWPIDRLLMEFENSHINRNNYFSILKFLGAAGLSNYVIKNTATVASQRFAVTAVLKGTGVAGHVITIASAAITYTAFMAEKRRIQDIDIHVTLDRVHSEISEQAWEVFERRVEQEYGSDPEPEELR